MTGDGEFDHLAALLETRDRLVRLVRRMRTGQKPDLIEPRLVAALFGQDQVAQVNRDRTYRRRCRFAWNKSGEFRQDYRILQDGFATLFHPMIPTKLLSYSGITARSSAAAVSGATVVMKQP